MLKPKARDKGR
ncbi:hypothetical protein IEO21_04628 [Rhodonia placenta]|uniref:Uncharacterized protein n=1 Tax=Rhodonia placenta TaxID=104341 RepID=A0A8H7P3I7_9APHY|nr:hypothetical protein IEO21_10849 [Postia placenta]KAF9803470.1 hypothetical protein IEO21_09679 [Postia placenta]KAF9815457.1 hypothetical protein IEO21_04628 [Postia placenta]